MTTVKKATLTARLQALDAHDQRLRDEMSQNSVKRTEIQLLLAGAS